MNEQEICPTCGGEGKNVIGNNYVTEDMAIDAGDKTMAGMFHSFEYEECDACEGIGIKPPSLTNK